MAIEHPDLQDLESYVLGRLGPPDDPAAASIEEHLLVCSGCVNRAEGAVEMAQLIRAVLRTLAREEEPNFASSAADRRSADTLRIS